MDQNNHRRKYKHQRGHGQLLRNSEGRRPTLHVFIRIE